MLSSCNILMESRALEKKQPKHDNFRVGRRIFSCFKKCFLSMWSQIKHRANWQSLRPRFKRRLLVWKNGFLVLLLSEKITGYNPCENTTGRRIQSTQSIGRTGRFGRPGRLHRLYFMTLLTFLDHRRDSEAGDQRDGSNWTSEPSKA